LEYLSATKDNKEPLAAMFERRRSAMTAEHAVVVRLLPPQAIHLAASRAMIEQDSRERAWTSGFPEIPLQVELTAAHIRDLGSGGGRGSWNSLSEGYGRELQCQSKHDDGLHTSPWLRTSGCSAQLGVITRKSAM
jgi:hypothetical protein